jgi:hypothetical protein
LKDEIFGLKSKYFEQSAKIRRMKKEVERKNKFVTEINDKKEQISSFKESGFEELIKEYKSFSQQNEEFKIIELQIKQKEKIISSILGELELKEMPKTDLVPSFYREEVEGVINNTLEEFNKIQSLVEDAYTRTTKLLLSYNKNIKNTEWSSKYNEVKGNFITTKDELANKGIHDLSKLEEITQELTNLEQELKRINAIDEMLSIENEKKSLLKEEFISKRKMITEKRREFLELVINDADNIKIELKPFRDQQSFINTFRDIFQKSNGYGEDINTIVQKCFRGADVIFNISQTVSHFKELRNLGRESDLGGRMQNVIRKLNEEQIDELDLLIPEDEVVVKYKPNGSASFKLLTNASAGQKTSAILSFLLSFGNTPLILDQPEDDLDNHLIYELIVERLKKSKDRRQIIVVTHNANIPVNGDSEWILCMDSETNGLKILCAGSVDVDLVKREICDVMEGGEDAFKLRARRYNLQ